MTHHTPSRRAFLQTIGTGLAASVVSPTILGASDKAGTKRPVIGSGEFTYEVYHDWGELPAGIKYGNTHGVCEDSHGQIYIHHTVHATSERHDTMVVFDSHGKFVRSWGAEFEGGAHGLPHPGAKARRVSLPLRYQARASWPRRRRKGRSSGSSATRRSRRDTRERRRDAGHQVLADQHRHRAERRLLRRRRLRLELHQPVRQHGEVHPHFRRQGEGCRSARLPARPDGRRSRSDAHADGRRPQQQALQNFSLDGTAPRVRRGLPGAVSLQRATGRHRRAGSVRARHADRSAEQGDRATR